MQTVSLSVIRFNFKWYLNQLDILIWCAFLVIWIFVKSTQKYEHLIYNFELLITTTEVWRCHCHPKLTNFDDFWQDSGMD